MDPILIVGATGRLGGTVARRLVETGVPVRAVVRDQARLTIPDVAAVPGDLLDRGSLRAALDGVEQVFTTANSFSGRGASSPTRVDLTGYRNLLAAARDAGVHRIVHTSAYGLTADNEVDYFRVKYQIDEVIRGSGVPWVLLRPAAFIDIWIDVIAGGIAKTGVATVFGSGARVSNYIAVSDVAEFAVRVLNLPGVQNEAIDLGGPSTLSAVALAELVGQRLKRPVKIRRIPLPVLRYAPAVIRPFNEVAARLMSLGHWSGSEDHRLDHWRVAADRFGVEPMTVESYLDQWSAG